MARIHVPNVLLAASVVAAFALQSCCCRPCRPHKPHPEQPAHPPIPPGNQVSGAFETVINPVWPPSDDGSTNSTAFSTGIFNGAQGVCVYDVSVHYQRKVTMFEVYAAPSSVARGELAGQIPGPDDTYLLERDPNDTPSASGYWYRDQAHGNELHGIYDGSNSYQLLIRATYLLTSLGADDIWATFTNISSGTWVPGSP